MSPTAIRIPLLALAATAGSIAAVSVTLSRPEALIDRSLHSALRGVAPAGEARTAARVQSSEVELLRRSSTDAGDDPPGFGQSLAVGDRITITGKGGERRTLEVADVRPLVEPNRPAASGSGPDLLLVTCTVLGGGPGAVVRFVIEDSGAAPAKLPVMLDRAL